MKDKQVPKDYWRAVRRVATESTQPLPDDVRRAIDEDDAIDEVVLGSRRLVHLWGRYAVVAIDRFQSGDTDGARWLEAYDRYVRETADETVRARRAHSRV